MCLEPTPVLSLAKDDVYGREDDEFGGLWARGLCQFLSCTGNSRRSSLGLTHTPNPARTSCVPLPEACSISVGLSVFLQPAETCK